MRSIVHHTKAKPPRRLLRGSGQHARATVRLILLLCLLFVVGCERKADGPAAFTWQTSEAAAMAIAKAERKPVIIDFSAQWNGASMEMARNTFGDDRFKSAAARFVALRIDATFDEDPKVAAVLEKYHVKGLPTILILDSSGQEQKRFNELVGVEAAVDAMANVQ